MFRFLSGLFNHGSILGYGGFPNGTWADTHHSPQVDDPLSRIHISTSFNYAWTHWTIRHEAAHAHFIGISEPAADSVANACGPDQKPGAFP